VQLHCVPSEKAQRDPSFGQTDCGGGAIGGQDGSKSQSGGGTKTTQPSTEQTAEERHWPKGESPYVQSSSSFGHA
jgi:hypothetical protein